MRPMDELISIGEAAQLLGKSVDTVRRWESNGRLTPVDRNLRGERVYRLLDVQALAAGRRAPWSTSLPSSGVSGEATGGAPSQTGGRLDDRLGDIWHSIRRYILKVTCEPIPHPDKSSIFYDENDPYLYRWGPSATDLCAAQCEQRVRRYLFPGVTFEELRVVVNRTVEAFVLNDLDARHRREAFDEGIDPDEL